MKCSACSKDLLKKETLYTEDRSPYCSNPATCNENHPNSIPNILERQGGIKMYQEEALESTLFNNLDVSKEMRNRIMKVATKPQSIRLSKIDIAHYLVQLQETKDFSSLSEAIRYCVGIAMEIMPIDAAMNNEPVPAIMDDIKINVGTTTIEPEKEPEPDSETKHVF